MDVQRKLFDEAVTEKFNWSKYNKSQTQEKTLFLKLLRELCDTIPIKRTGNQIFCLATKAYAVKSSRRISGELELCRRAGYIPRVPHFNSLLYYLRSHEITNTLNHLITLSSLPLQAVERKFCCDSTGFGSSILDDRWSKIRQTYSKHHKYLKAHIVFGTLTNIVTACKITEGTSPDAPHLPFLADETAKSFKMDEFSADKAYLSRDNLESIYKHGCLPLIPFKKNAKSWSKGHRIWQEMYNFFHKNQELFMKKYHLRSNAESGIFMIKSRFGDLTAMRHPTAIINDILSKILCHNLCVLCQEIFFLGIDFDFAQLSQQAAQA